MHVYETLILSTPEMTTEEVEALVAKYTGIIEERGGTIRKTDLWGKRVLAYPINKVPEGYYSLVEFDGDGDLVTELDRRLKIDEAVMRHIVVNLDHNIRLEAKSAEKRSKKRRNVQQVAAPTPVEETKANTEAKAEVKPEAAPAEAADVSKPEATEED